MTNYVKICAIKYLNICYFFLILLQNQLIAAENEVGICRNPEFLSACWEKEINRASNDKSFALLCMSRNGNAHGFFLEKNGIGFDDEGKWEFYNESLLYILGEDCKIKIYNEYEFQISECKFNGSWKVRCRVEDPASTACP